MVKSMNEINNSTTNFLLAIKADTKAILIGLLLAYSERLSKENLITDSSK